MDGATSTQTMRAQLMLRERILSGQIKPGTRLLEVPLAESMGVSRTPLRDALSRLAEEGLLERAERGGFEVRAFSIADALDALELRGVLEGTAARLAAERGVDDETMAVFEHILDRMEESFNDDGTMGNLDAYGELNGRFHRLLWELSGSSILQRELTRISALPFASPSALMHEESGDQRFRRLLIAAQAQHRSIVSAVLRREGTRAEAVAREHARIARQNLEDVLSSGRSRFRHLPSLALVVD